MEIAQYHEINSRCSKKIWNIYEFRQGVLSQDLYKVSRFIRINIFHGFTDWVSFVMLQLKCVQIKVFTNTLMTLSAKTPGDSSVGMPSALQIVLLIKIEDSWNWKINWAIINGYGFSLTLQIQREMPKCCSISNKCLMRIYCHKRCSLFYLPDYTQWLVFEHLCGYQTSESQLAWV